MKIAIVGSGIAGNTAAWLLRDQHDITVFEAADYVGGHTNTVDVDSSAGPLAVDTGFIVFNDRTYPEFNRLLGAIGQPWQPSVMSFSVRNDDIDLEYNGASLNTLFAQRRNVARPLFIRMVRDILRFNQEAPRLLRCGEQGLTVGDYLQQHGYGDGFRRYYLVPMAAAIWSAEPRMVLDIPVFFLVRFFQNHGLLQLKDRPQWRVITGGSCEYVKRLVAGHRDRIRLRSAVRTLRRDASGVNVQTDSGTEQFDSVFVACHSDQALALLQDATRLEREVLGSIPYQSNEAVLHTDHTLMPRRRRAWAAWNYHFPRSASGQVSVTYNMNILQNLPVPEQYLVTLNSHDEIAPDKIIRRVQYDHPVFSDAATAAQARQSEVNCGNRSYFCGAYWRNGFHEDGVVSAIRAVRQFEEELDSGQLHFRRAG
ncbi:MAG: NAD(P)-binding protein [Woeseia sp.]|nr:NAD(P)-binding protein [Woeseia sp.]